MSNLPGMLQAWWSDGHSPETMPFGAALDEIQRRAGSGRKAAASLGIPETTWRRLKGGVTPKTQARYRDRLSTELRRLLMPPQPAPGRKVTVELWNPRTRHTEHRRFVVLPKALGRAQGRYVAGNLTGAAASFRAGITDDWYRGFIDNTPGDDSEPYPIALSW